MTEGTVDPVEAMGAMMRSALEGVSGAVTAIRESQEAMVAEIRALRPAPAAGGEGEGENDGMRLHPVEASSLLERDREEVAAARERERVRPRAARL
jgi:hypothetical protein